MCQIPAWATSGTPAVNDSEGGLGARDREMASDVARATVSCCPPARDLSLRDMSTADVADKQRSPLVLEHWGQIGSTPALRAQAKRSSNERRASRLNRPSPSYELLDYEPEP